jgi:hypothetical protein
MTVANNPAAQLDWLDDPSQEPKLSMLSYAKACVARGWKIFPLQPRQKNPATPHGFKDATNDLEQINRWWTENTNYNIGVACGESNLTVLDFDSDTGYSQYIAQASLPETFAVKTSRGIHKYFSGTTASGNLLVSGQVIEAPIAGENTPPASGAKNLTYHLSRIFFSVGNTVYWTSGPDAPVGNGIEGVAPANTQVFPSLVTRIVPTTLGAIVFTVSDIYMIPGQGTSTSPIQPAFPYLQGIGLLNYNALSVNGAIMGFYSSDKQFLILDPSSGVSESGFPIANKLDTSQWNGANVYVTWHAAGQDKAWFISDGSTGWYRLSLTPAPEQGLTWSPFATIVGGAKAVQSIETSPGVKTLLLGPSTSGPILKRSLTSWQDNTSNYTWSATVGSHVLAVPGQLAEVPFLTVESVAVGTSPSLSVVMDEAVPFFTGAFAPLSNPTNDPPTLHPSASIYAQRFYMSETGQPAVCRTMQYKIDLPAENAQNEILSVSIFGCHLIEN